MTSTRSTVRDEWQAERNSDITVDQMLGRNAKRELFPVEETDHCEVNRPQHERQEHLDEVAGDERKR